jgi:hypothetical protein
MMKNATLYLMILLMSVSIIPTPTYAAEKNPTTISTPPKEVPAEVQVMLDRLKEIKAMDKSNMTRTEKRALRKEVRTISSAIRSSGNGIYLSLGAILIIILLIILL